MVKSMFAAVAGLRTHQSKMDVIGNNIANVNTYGYKKERASFADTYYATSRVASEANGIQGGSNPSQVGYGVQVAGVSNIVTTGGNAITDNPTDVMITGNGYFLVGNYNEAGYTTTSTETGIGDQGALTSLYLTRVGLFNFDGQGSLVDGNGNYVYGYTSARGNQALKNPDGGAHGPNDSPKTWVYEYDTPDTSAGAGADDTVTVSYTVREVIATDGTVVGYEVHEGTTPAEDGSTLVMSLGKSDFDPDTYESLYVLPDVSESEFSNPEEYKVDQNTGYIKNIATGIVATNSDKLNAIQYPRIYTVNGYVDAKGEPVEATLYSENDSVVVRGYKVNADGSIEEDLEDITVSGEQYWDLSKPIEMNSLSIGSDGTVSGVHNKQVYSLGKIAVANVPNPVALEAQGNNYYMAKANTGVVEAFNPGEGSTGTLQSNTLEMSNVDLSNEFTEMITTQRGFQANSRIITVTDSMLEELVNLKRS